MATESYRRGEFPRRWFALFIVLTAMFMNQLDVTIVNVALPYIQRDLGAGVSLQQWILAGFALAFALLLVTGGRLGDITGRKKVFLTGVAGFTAASALAGLAQSGEMMAAARVAQGVFAALMVPQVLSVIQVMFQPPERLKAMGLLGVVVPFASITGPVVGALLTAGPGWRWIFWVNVPIGVLAFSGAARLVPESKSDRPLRLDIPGVLLLGLASIMLMFPLVQGHELGWPVWTVVSMALSLPLFALFGIYQFRTEGASPLVPPALFRNRSFVAGSVLMALVFSGIMSYLIVLVWDFQVAHGWSPLRMALTGLGWTIGLGLTANIAVRYGAVAGRRLIGLGLAVMVAGMAALILVLRHYGGATDSWQVFACLLVAGMGSGLVVPILVDLVLAGVPARDAGAGSGVANATIQLGTAVGVAMVGAIFFGLVGTGPRDPAVWAGATWQTLLYNAGVFLLAVLLVPLLPRRTRRHEATVGEGRSTSAS
ncbi:EmrB/QacA subfamily drug resistance transporter [Nonomuraea thailandensis]|uniref:EmrB/QacA subfamily drug resistance transporter n=1 Tax=Nonomuraea thailandensis TaxID=1188745 RepID=A0A9X2GS30_9ACTN|nr:MFS transporter [Nonomuraea thailandensis]MCP2362900.1 EmrB/QacA subfamily drug resistance transporter [Nonomuraea thailandensis]